MAEMQFRQLGFTCSACGPFKERKEIRQRKDTKILDISSQRNKDLTRRTASDKTSRDKEFNIAKNSKYDWYPRALASMVYKFLVKRFQAKQLQIKNNSNKELAEELHKPIIKEFKKRKVTSPFIDNIRGADPADMQLITKCNKEIRFLLFVIYIYSKYAWAIPLKDKKWYYNYYTFQKIL